MTHGAWPRGRATLKNFDTDSFTVDEGGTGHFFSVAQACDFARDAFDVVNNAVTVFIRNGLYDHEAPKNVAMGYPYAIINKGANRISLIGESRDGVIVSYENNSVNRAKIIEAGRRMHHRQHDRQLPERRELYGRQRRRSPSLLLHTYRFGLCRI